MPIGVTFLKLGKGETLSAGELDQLRVRMNFIESTASRAGEVMASQGAGLNPDVFQNSGMFSLLPHEAASMFQGTAQTIPTATDTTLLFDAASGATWSHGIAVDAATGRITVAGANRNNLLLIVAWGQWAVSAGGTIRDLKLKTDDGSLRGDRQAGLGGSTVVYTQIVHARRTPSATTYYYVDVSHDAGTDLDFDDFGFVVVRLR